MAARKKAGAGAINEVAKRFGITAREARDIATAVGNVGAVIRDKGNAGALGGTRRQLGAAAKEIKKQVGETAKAATSGSKGTRSKQYMTITGDQPARLMAQRSTKKPTAAKSTAMGQAAKSHQKGLAKVSGETAAANKATAMRKAKNTFGIMDQTGAAKGRAYDRTLKSFKKSN